jgi:alginate O-acetyltransferase complex protein AlgJ
MDHRTFRSSEDRLYLVGGSNNAKEAYTNEGFSAAVNVNLWGDRINARTVAVEAAGAKFAQLIVPEKLAIHPLNPIDSAQLFGPEVDVVAPGRRLASALNVANLCYPDAYLAEQAKRYAIYPSSDSHWTWAGAFSAFQLLMSMFGNQPNYQDYIRLPRKHLTYRGDLWEPLFEDMVPEEFERLILPDHVRRVYCNPLIGLKEEADRADDLGLHVGSHCIFVNSKAQIRQDAVIFGTSFSESRIETSLLTAAFAFFFETTHFVWSTSLDLDYIRRHRPAVVIAEQPERFLTSCPEDTLNTESFAAARISNWRRDGAVDHPRR